MSEKNDAKLKALEETVQKKYQQKDKRKEPKMSVTGKSVFALQKLITHKKPKK